MNNENQLEYDIDKEMLQRHAVTVLEGLGAAVESLEESDFLNSVLISIGQTHVQRHVKPNMLRVGHLNLKFFNISKMRLFNLYQIMFLLLDNQNACYMLGPRTVIFFSLIKFSNSKQPGVDISVNSLILLTRSNCNCVLQWDNWLLFIVSLSKAQTNEKQFN